MLADQRNRTAGIFTKFRLREFATGMKTLKNTRLTESTCGWRAGYEIGYKATVMLFGVVDGLVDYYAWTEKEVEEVCRQPN